MVDTDDVVLLCESVVRRPSLGEVIPLGGIDTEWWWDAFLWL